MDIHTAEQFREWLLHHRVFALDAGKPDRRIVRGMAGKKTVVVIVPTPVMRAVDDELIWPHHPDGHLLPDGTLFALRTQYVPLH